MSENKSTSNYTLNLLIIGIAIILVILVQQNLNGNDSFVGKVPITSIGNAPYYNIGGYPGVYPTGQPMMYNSQYYPAKYPYYNDTINNIGRPCNNSETGCGVFGACVNGVCTIKDKKDTVFDIVM